MITHYKGELRQCKIQEFKVGHWGQCWAEKCVNIF